MCTRYATAAQNLTSIKNGWHFGAARATPAQVRDFRLEDLARSMRTKEPELWRLVFGLLGGIDVVAEDNLWHAGTPEEDAEDAQYWLNDDDAEKISDLKGGAKLGKKRRERAALIRVVRASYLCGCG